MPNTPEYKTLTERIDAIYKRIENLKRMRLESVKPGHYNRRIATLRDEARQLTAERERLFDQWQRVKR